MAGTDVGDLYIIELDPSIVKKGLEANDEVVEIFKIKSKKEAIGTLVYLRYPEEAEKSFVSIMKDEVIGTLRPILPLQSNKLAKATPEAVQVVGACFAKDKQEAVNFCLEQDRNFKEFKRVLTAEGFEGAKKFVKENPDKQFDSIVIFPTKRQMTEQEIQQMEEGAKERKSKWNLEKIKTVFSKTLSQIQEEFREEVADFLFQHRRVYAECGDDIRFHCSTIEFDAIYPASLSIHVAPRFSGTMAKLVNCRMQQSMMRRGQMEVAPADEIVCSHRFLAVKKPGAKPPLDKTALDEMTDDQVDRCFRAVLDVSSLTKITHQSCSTLPLVLEAMGRKLHRSITTYLDISLFFYQLRITTACRSLFCIESDIPGVSFLRLCVLA